MEANSILNAFVVAASQYTASQTEQNLLHLQRHLDVVMGLSASSSDLEFFDPRQIVITEFVTSLINILLEAEPKLGLVQRVLSVLQNLVKIPTIKDSLQSTFYVHSALSIFLQNFGVSVKDPLVMQCLQLLEIFTCGINISYIESHLENLIHVLIKQIDNKSPELLLPALHILSNLCRHNFQIQSYIRNMPNMKQVYKALVSKLCSPIPTVVVYTLSTLASLSFNNDMGEKLFTAKHTVKTFELIVNMLVASDQKAKYAALDLLMDLMEFPKLQTHFIRYQHLNLILQKVVDTCSKESSSEQSLMYLKFLLTFMKIPDTKIHVSSVLCSKRGNDESDNFSGGEIHHFLIHWALQTVDTAGDTPVIALQLLKSIIKSYPDDKIEHIEPCLREILPALSSMMTEYVDFDSLLLKKHLQRQVAGFSLLYAICQKPNFQNDVSKHLNIKNCEQIVKAQLENNSLSCKENEWSEVGVDLLLLAIGVVAVIKDSLSGADEFLNTVLQETRLMPFLAYALCSTCPDRVNKALFVLSLSSDLPMFPYQMLGENIAATNNNHYQRKSDLSETDEANFDAKPSLNSFEYSTLKSVAMHNRRNSVDRNVQTLIHKIENGLDLRDLKSSEIMDMYEHKIAALSLKERELQDLVQAKSTALQQADRILSQYKCRQAQRDAEALRLRSLLKESERRSEAAREQANQAVQQQLKLHRELEAAHQEINCLEQQNEEQKENMGEQLQRLAASQKTLENLQVEYNSISEMHAMLQRHSETMKQKQDLMTQQSLQLEEDKKYLTKQLKEKDTKIKEVNKQLQKAEELFKKKEEEYEDLKTSKEALEKASDKTEKRKCKLEQEVSSLELVCKQYEASLEEKDAEIKSLLGQLDKHKHITEMIHEITSGRISVASLLDK